MSKYQKVLMAEDVSMSEAFLKQLNQVVEQNLTNEQFSVEDLAREVGFSRSQVHRKLQSLTGQSISQFIREFRLQRAHQLLLKQVGTASEIAYQVGFNSPTYFNKCFHEYYGYPPGETINRSLADLTVENTFTSAEITNRSNSVRSLLLILLGLVVVAAGIFLVIPQTDQIAVTSQSASEISIGVLPFKIIGGDPQGKYFSEGVQEEILNHLSRIQGLRVKSRTSMEIFQGQTPNLDQLAALGLTHYLEASTRKNGDRFRITVQLIDARTNDHLWAQNYDGDYANIWDTQSDIARKVAEALQIKISPQTVESIQKKPTRNTQAWDDYLNGQYFWRKYLSLRQPHDLRKSVSYLKSSIHQDPDFALAYTTLALAYQQQSVHPDITFDFINADSVLTLLNTAIEKDPSLSEPYEHRGNYFAYVTKDTVAAHRDFKQAIQNGPHLPNPYWRYGSFLSLSRHDLAGGLKYCFLALEKQPQTPDLVWVLVRTGWIYLGVGEYEKAAHYIEKALVYEPENLAIMIALGHLYRVAQWSEKSYQMAQRMIEVSPRNRGLYELGMYHMLQGDYQHAVSSFQKFYAEAQETSVQALHGNHMYGYSLLKTGDAELAQQKLDIALQFLLDKGQPTEDFELAKIYAARKLTDSALFHLERAVATMSYWGMQDWMEIDPLLESIREQPEFKQLVALAHEKVQVKALEIIKLETAGEVPLSLEGLDYL